MRLGLLLLLTVVSHAQIVVRRGALAAAAASIVITEPVAGTVQASGHTCTISSITLSTGDSIAAMSATASLVGTVTATWNSVSMTETLGAGVSSGNVETHSFNLDNVTGATGNLVMTKSNAGDDPEIFDCRAVRVTGLTSKVIDKSRSNTGTATTWDTGTSATTTAANEGLVAFLAAAAATNIAFGTWQNSFARLGSATGQSSGGCCVIDIGTRVVSATGTYIGQTTSNTSEAFAGVLFTFK